MCVCKYVFIYVCMYVCMYVCVYVSMCSYMYVCIYVCMYVCTYVFFKLIKHAPLQWSNTTRSKYFTIYNLTKYTNKINPVPLEWHLISLCIYIYPIITDQSLLILYKLKMISGVSLLAHI